MRTFISKMSRTQKAHFAAVIGLTLGLVGSKAFAQAAAPSTPAAEMEAPEYPPPSARWKVVAAGLGTSAAFYGAAVGASYLFPDTPGMNQMRTPIVGPWLAIANGGCPAGEDCSTVLAVVRVVLSALDGAGQAGGLAIALEGMFMPTQEWAAAAPPAAPPPSAPPPSGPKSPTPPPAPGGGEKLFWLPTPMTVGSTGMGLGVVGRF